MCPTLIKLVSKRLSLKFTDFVLNFLLEFLASTSLQLCNLYKLKGKWSHIHRYHCVCHILGCHAIHTLKSLVWPAKWCLEAISEEMKPFMRGPAPVFALMKIQKYWNLFNTAETMKWYYFPLCYTILNKNYIKWVLSIFLNFVFWPVL